MSELSDHALNEIQKAVTVAVITDKEGNEWSTRSVYFMKAPKEPREVLPAPNCLNVFTLTSLVDFCLRDKEKKDFSKGDPAIIHITSHNSVTLASEPFGPTLQRTMFVAASFESLLGTSFKFGEYYDQEAFIVGLQSLFEPTPARADVLKVIGTIKENQVRSFSDDGVTQSVAASAGQVLVSEVQVPNPVYLKPFRTFREIEQPESPFILRVRQGKDRPQCALFEADGGRWKLTAIQLIKEYLEDQIELPIFA
jgi:hypothetical protein